MVRTGQKGEGSFSPVSWRDAVALVARRLGEVRERWGGEAILPYYYGGSNGLVTQGTLDARFFAALGASRLDRAVCAAPTGTVAKAMTGKMPGVAFPDYEAARLLTLEAAWMADNSKPNSLMASMAKAKAGRAATEIALRCVELCGAAGYGESELLEKWARDAKILDIFEGTQQIQLLIVARQLLGRSSTDLR